MERDNPLCLVVIPIEPALRGHRRLDGVDGRVEEGGLKLIDAVVEVYSVEAPEAQEEPLAR